MKAILVKDILKGFTRHAALYRMEPPLDGHGFVIASAASPTPAGPETYLFPADAEGDVVSWTKMDGSYRGGLSHAEAFAGVGYSIEIPAKASDSIAKELEAAAKLLEQKASDFALEYGSNDLGGLLFERGAHADGKLEYHNTLLEIAEKIRSLAQVAGSVLEDAERLKEAAGLLEELAEHGSYSIEYDGRMIPICPECGEHEGDHRPDCAFARAKAFLAARKRISHD